MIIIVFRMPSGGFAGKLRWEQKACNINACGILMTLGPDTPFGPRISSEESSGASPQPFVRQLVSGRAESDGKMIGAGLADVIRIGVARCYSEPPCLTVGPQLARCSASLNPLDVRPQLSVTVGSHIKTAPCHGAMARVGLIAA